ncbi:MAG: manganese efflux pump [Ammonifex sp.]|nr:MAG: manganese efflux pump [Ammonifex sp.]
MNLLTIVLLAVALGVDAFSVCLGIGLVGVSRRRSLLLIAIIAVFHVIMPLTGWWAGETLGAYLGRLAGIVGAVLLFFLGGRMIYAAVRCGVPEVTYAVLPGTVVLLSLGASVSMDALAVGFTLGVYRYEPLVVAVTVGLVAGLMTALGLGLGRVISAWVGRRAQLVGGLILFAVGVNLLR